MVPNTKKFTSKKIIIIGLQASKFPYSDEHTWVDFPNIKHSTYLIENTLY